MDIVVEGKASEFFKPDMVKLNLNFYTKTEEYESALREGTENVQNFIEEVILKLGFKKEELIYQKSQNMIMKRNKIIKMDFLIHNQLH